MEENVKGAQLPHSVVSEQALLVSMFRNKDCIPEVIMAVKPEDIYVDVNRALYTAIYTRFNHAKPTNNVDVRNEVLREGKYTQEQLDNYIEQIYRDTLTSANVQSCIEIILDKALLRNLALTAVEMSKRVASGLDVGADLLELSEQWIYSLRQGRSLEGLVSMSEVMHNVYEQLDELAKQEGGLAGISCGFKDLDKMISGLRRSDLLILAARPAMGKTTLALNILLEAAKKSQQTVAFFSLEMSMEQLGMRLIAAESFLDNKKLVSGRLDDADWEKMMLACSSLLAMDIKVNDDAMVTVADIKARCRREENLGLIVIDYLQLMSGAGGTGRQGQNRQEMISEITRSLKLMAKELKVPVLCLSQLSRSSERREDKRPVMADIRDSGAVEQDADVIMFIYRDEYYNPDTDKPNVAEIIVAKNRQGETGTVELGWVPQFSAFRNIAHGGPKTPPPY